jgi:hypothetical protein
VLVVGYAVVVVVVDDDVVVVDDDVAVADMAVDMVLKLELMASQLDIRLISQQQRFPNVFFFGYH